MRGDHDVADVLERLHEAEAAHVVELPALRIEPAAGVGVVARQLLHDLRHRDAVRHQPVRVDLHLILHRLAAQTGVVGHALNRAIAALEHPVLENLEFLRRPIRALQHVPVDEAARTEQRRHARCHAGRNLRVRDALEGLLARKIRIGVVLEVHRDRRQPVERDRAKRVELRDAVHLDLERNRDEALDLLGRMARPLRHDLHPRRRQIRIGVDRQVLKRDDAPDRQAQHRHDDDESLREREGNNAVDHGVTAGRCSRTAGRRCLATRPVRRL